MPELCPQLTRPSRLARRAAQDITIRTIWPSAFTTQPLADAWIVDEGDGVLTLQVGDRCLAVIQGLDVDQHSFNALLDRMRLRPPRPRR